MQQLCCLLFFSLSQYFWVIKMNKYKKRGEKRREKRREKRIRSEFRGGGLEWEGLCVIG